MRRGKQSLAAGLALASVALVLAAVPGDPRTTECEVKVADPIKISAEPITVQATFTEALGDSLVAAFQPESKITVVGVTRQENDEPQSARLALNTSQAAAGEWAVTLKGTAGQCGGKVAVAAADGELN